MAAVPAAKLMPESLQSAAAAQTEFSNEAGAPIFWRATFPGHFATMSSYHNGNFFLRSNALMIWAKPTRSSRRCSLRKPSP